MRSSVIPTQLRAHHVQEAPKVLLRGRHWRTIPALWQALAAMKVRESRGDAVGRVFNPSCPLCSSCATELGSILKKFLKFLRLFGKSNPKSRVLLVEGQHQSVARN